jgi:RES domain-containing protein
VRVFSGHVWRQCAPTRRLLDVASPAAGPGRYHRAGEPGAWYASPTERGAWVELLRHHVSGELSPFEIRRRIGLARVESLRLLDLTDPQVREALALTEADLTSDDLTRCQALGHAARAAGFEGILAPSAALAGEVILVVFPAAMAKVTEKHSRVQRAPARLRALVRRIRRPGRATPPDPPSGVTPGPPGQGSASSHPVSRA